MWGESWLDTKPMCAASVCGDKIVQGVQVCEDIEVSLRTAPFSTHHWPTLWGRNLANQALGCQGKAGKQQLLISPPNATLTLWTHELLDKGGFPSKITKYGTFLALKTKKIEKDLQLLRANDLVILEQSKIFMKSAKLVKLS